MNKFSYIKWSYEEANRKIWDALLNKYQSIRKKNRLLSYLWLFVASILFGLIVIFGWLAYLTVFFQDVRFTPHYMRTVIQHNSMTTEQANEYLKSQMQKYKTSLSYGNISNKERNSIEATFELLYDEYRLPEPIDEEQEEIKSKITDIKAIVCENDKGIENIQSVVQQTKNDIQVKLQDIHSDIQTVSAYTDKKQLEDEAKRALIDMKQKQQETKKQDFGARFEDWQFDILTKCINEVRIFEKPMNSKTLGQIFSCTLENPLKIAAKKNKLLIYLFTELSNRNYIIREWQAVCAKNELFLSSKEGIPLTQDNISSTVNTSIESPPKDSHIIDQYIKQLKQY